LLENRLILVALHIEAAPARQQGRPRIIVASVVQQHRLYDIARHRGAQLEQCNVVEQGGGVVRRMHMLLDHSPHRAAFLGDGEAVVATMELDVDVVREVGEQAVGGSEDPFR
jgi:hypothetical protein